MNANPEVAQALGYEVPEPYAVVRGDRFWRGVAEAIDMTIALAAAGGLAWLIVVAAVGTFVAR